MVYTQLIRETDHFIIIIITFHCRVVHTQVVRGIHNFLTIMLYCWMVKIQMAREMHYFLIIIITFHCWMVYIHKWLERYSISLQLYSTVEWFTHKWLERCIISLQLSLYFTIEWFIYKWLEKFPYNYHYIPLLSGLHTSGYRDRLFLIMIISLQLSPHPTSQLFWFLIRRKYQKIPFTCRKHCTALKTNILISCHFVFHYQLVITYYYEHYCYIFMSWPFNRSIRPFKLTLQFDHSTIQIELTVWPFKTLNI